MPVAGRSPSRVGEHRNSIGNEGTPPREPVWSSSHREKARLPCSATSEGQGIDPERPNSTPEVPERHRGQRSAGTGIRSRAGQARAQ